jgi:hypothetical protein
VIKHAASLIVSIFFLLCCAIYAIADDSSDEIVANPNRPTVSNPADITQYGVLEMEYGVELDHDSREVCGLFKFAVLKDLELRLSTMSFELDRQTGLEGFGDTTAGFQYRFLHQSKSVPSMAFYYGLKFPTAQAELGNGRYDHDFLWLVSKDIGNAHVDFNLDFPFVGKTNASGFDHFFAPALAISSQFAGKWTVAGEISGATKENADTPANSSFLVAVSFALRPRLVFDSALSFGLSGGLPHTTFLAGFTYSIAQLRHGGAS